MKIIIELDTVDPAEQVARQILEDYGDERVKVEVAVAARPHYEVRLTGELDDVFEIIVDVWNSGDWREAIQYVAQYAKVMD